MNSEIKMTVYFDDPFWVGVFERIHEGHLQTSRIVFGSEPKDYEVYEFVLRNFYLLRFGKAVEMEEKPQGRINPKRLQRQIRRATEASGVGTKAQQAMKLEYESRKIEIKKCSREQREEMERQKFLKHQEKKKEKRKGH